MLKQRLFRAINALANRNYISIIMHACMLNACTQEKAPPETPHGLQLVGRDAASCDEKQRGIETEID